MPLSWNEIKTHANAFAKEWQDESREDAEAKSFWDAFFDVFGITRRRIASFEGPAKKSDGKGGFVDLLWHGQLLIEHKSRGKSLDKAVDAAYGYKPALSRGAESGSDATRVAFLFERYQQITSLLPIDKPKRLRRAR